MKASLKSIIKRMMQTPLGRPLGAFYRGRCTFVMYHRISQFRQVEQPPEMRYPNSLLAVSREDFDVQIEYLSKNFQCIPIDQAIDGLTGKKNLPERPMVITFDDGHRDQVDLGMPILKKYRVPATIYLTTGLMDGRCSLWWYEHEAVIDQLASVRLDVGGVGKEWNLGDARSKVRALWELGELYRRFTPELQREATDQLFEQAEKHTGRDLREPFRKAILSWDEIRALSREPLITLGAHTLHHPVLRDLDETEMEKELVESKRELEAQLKIEVRHLAYPFGGVREAATREFAAARRAGFRSAVTTRPGHVYANHANRLHALPRILLNERDCPKNLDWKLGGLSVMTSRPWSRFILD